MTDADGESRDEVLLAFKRAVFLLQENGIRLMAGAVIGLFMGLFAFLFASPYFTASATLVAADTSVQDNRNSSLSALTSLAGVGAATQLAPFDRLQIVLRSRELARQILLDSRARQILFPGRWNPASNQWQRETGVKAFIKDFLSPNTTSDPGVDRAEAVLFGRLSTLADKTAGTVTIKFIAAHSNDAVYMLNLVLNRADNVVRRDYLEVAQGYADYINRELPDVTAVTTRTALTDLMANYQRTIVMAHVNLPFSFLAIDPTSAPEKPSGPSLTLYLGVGIVLGLLGAAFWKMISPWAHARFGTQRSRNQDI